MARPRRATGKPAGGKRPIEQYDHRRGQRKNNPPVGLVTEATDSIRYGANFQPFVNKRDIKDGAEIDAERIEAYRGTVSLPFDTGAHKRAAVKIVDDRGIESLKIIPLP